MKILTNFCRSVEYINVVRASVAEEPKMSNWRSRGLTEITTWRIFLLNLALKAYKVQVPHKLKPLDRLLKQKCNGTIKLKLSLDVIC